MEAQTTPPTQHGEFDITSQDANRAGIPSNYVIHLIAVAGDPQSGIKDIAITSKLNWVCYLSPGVLTGSPQTGQLAFAHTASPVNPVSTWTIDVAADPILKTTGCSTQSGLGAYNISGTVSVTATNGAAPARTATSKTFFFTYADIINP